MFPLVNALRQQGLGNMEELVSVLVIGMLVPVVLGLWIGLLLVLFELADYIRERRKK